MKWKHENYTETKVHLVDLENHKPVLRGTISLVSVPLRREEKPEIASDDGHTVARNWL